MISKILSIAGDTLKIDSLLSSDFILKPAIPRFNKQWLKRAFLNLDKEYYEHYQKIIMLDSINYITLELNVFNTSIGNNTNKELLLFSKINNLDWKFTGSVGLDQKDINKNFIGDYFDGYEILINELKNNDFIIENYNTLNKYFNGEVNNKLENLELIKIRLLQFYIWADYFMEDNNRHICISYNNTSFDFYIQCSLKLNCFNNWKLNKIGIFRVVSD